MQGFTQEQLPRWLVADWIIHMKMEGNRQARPLPICTQRDPTYLPTQPRYLHGKSVVYMGRYLLPR